MILRIFEEAVRLKLAARLSATRRRNTQGTAASFHLPNLSVVFSHCDKERSVDTPRQLFGFGSMFLAVKLALCHPLKAEAFAPYN